MDSTGALYAGERSPRSSINRSAELFEELLDRNVERLDAACTPELTRDGVRRRIDRPRSVVEPIAAPDPAQKDAQGPVARAVAEEEEVTTPKLRHQAHRHDR